VCPRCPADTRSPPRLVSPSRLAAFRCGLVYSISRFIPSPPITRKRCKPRTWPGPGSSAPASHGDLSASHRQMGSEPVAHVLTIPFGPDKMDCTTVAPMPIIICRGWIGNTTCRKIPGSGTCAGLGLGAYTAGTLADDI
jgi:hypothetical protein